MSQKQAGSKKAVILVGHGGIPRDCPRELVNRLRTLEQQRRATGRAATAEERELDARIRHWPRTGETDPYHAGLEALADQLRPLLNGVRLALAYNEFCAPDLKEAVASLAADGVQTITVISSMLTPGGSHSEIEIPEELESLRTKHPQIEFRYAWPFDLQQVAEMLMVHLRRFT